jgi:hypothetical protein
MRTSARAIRTDCQTIHSEQIGSHDRSNKMTNPTPEPLATLDPSGHAAIISYSVPEPTSYSGHNYINIAGLPDEAFSTVVAVPTAGGAVSPSGGGAVVHLTAADGIARPPAVAAAIPITNLATAGVVAPNSVSVGAGAEDASPVLVSPLPLSEDLAKLTNADVAALSASGQQVVLYPNIAGQLAMKVLPMMAIARDGGGDGGPDPVIVGVWVTIATPTSNAVLRGPSAGVTFSLGGSIAAENLTGDPSVSVSVDGGAAVPAAVGPAAQKWGATLTVTAAGQHTILVAAHGSGLGPHGTKIVRGDTATVTVTVVLDPTNPNPAPELPSVEIIDPVDNTTLVSSAALTALSVTGKSRPGAGRTVAAVEVSNGAAGSAVKAGPTKPNFEEWAVELAVRGLGWYIITVTATDDQGNKSSVQTVRILLTAQQPFRRLKNRLLIVETLNLSSYLGAFGAGRVIKTFSLLPGEKTTISVKSWTKSSDSKKAGSSIVDSDATEAATDFEQTLSAEQSSKEAQGEASNYKIGATASASWGFGNASINAEVSGSANASREEAAKNISAATQKHSMKASANRSVTINTEYTTTEETGTESSTVREIANINVSRTLNFVFRQMNQEHITLIHLTNARVAYYTEDLMLDPQGNPAYVQDPTTHANVLDIRRSYTEAPLPELQSLLNSAVTEAWRPKVQDAIINALSGIPDYEDELQTVVEYVTPTKDGAPVPGAEYLRFPRNLKTDFVDPEGGTRLNVPGIVLSYDHIVMRTEGVMVDAVLGQGDALDEYSHGLQNIAVAERQLAVDDRDVQVAREKLAQQIVADKDADMAATWQKVYPQPLSVPATITVPVTAGTDGGNVGL